MNEKKLTELIEKVADAVVQKLKDERMIRNITTAQEGEEIIRKAVIDDTLDKLLEPYLMDPYVDILYMYYEQGFTLETIANSLNCDISTVSRQKKRLCEAVQKVASLHHSNTTE